MVSPPLETTVTPEAPLTVTLSDLFSWFKGGFGCGLLIDCLRGPGCHKEGFEDPRSLETEADTERGPEREPGVANLDISDGVVGVMEDNGEKGRICFGKDGVEEERQTAASDGTTNQRRAASSEEKATV